MDLSMPNTVPATKPGEPYVERDYVYDHVPSLIELLPKFRGRPGMEYMQCCVINLRRAQDEGWTEVDNTVIYIIEGPKGDASMKLLARGKVIVGQPHNSGARLCQCDKAVEDLTGVWINPHNHEEISTEPETEVDTLSSATQHIDTRTPPEETAGAQK